jgi:hypothetical protein
MNPRSRVLIIVGMVAAAVALVTAPALAGGATSYKSKVTLAQTNPFHGQVKSDKPACEVSRTVTVYQAKYTGDSIYDSTKTGASNKWSIPATPNGNFYAKVSRRVGNKVICKSAVSPTRHFGQ